MKNLKSKDIYESVKKIYFDILQREPDSDGLEYWSNILKEKTMTVEEIKSEFYNSQEFEQLDPKYNFSNEKDPPKGFFDNYPNFFQTSKTVEHPNHLNGRFKAIIESNSDIIKNSSILDIASHDGRWSFAALKNGAKNVLGIEAREYLVKNSYQNMITYKIEPNSYQFVTNDIHKEIQNLKPNQFDIIFCLDFLYHTIEHNFLFSQIKRLNPKFIVIDTRIDLSNERIIKLHVDRPTKFGEAHAFPYDKSKQEILVGTPSKLGLEMMLNCFGFTEISYFDWKNKIQNFRNLVDYYYGKRITLRAKNTSKLI